MEMTAKQVMKTLKQNGWELAGINNSHHIFVKDGCARLVPVPVHKGKDDSLEDFVKVILKEADIAPKTLKKV